MKSVSVFFQDMVNSFKKPKVIIPIIVVLFIPVLYSGMFLKAFWDPYGKMNEIPVAVVNEDAGAEFDGQSLQVGDELVDELRKGNDFAWDFVTREQAEEGMRSNKYYMTIVIPDNFSSQATTLMDENPQPAELLYEPNEGYNFLAAQIGGTAVKEIKSKVSAKVTEAYTETLLDQVKQISGGLGEAGSGASKINEGAVKLDDGAEKLKKNLAKLAEGTAQLSQGISPLQQGASSLNQGATELSTGAASLNSGLQQLSTAHKQLADGAAKAQQGGAQLEQGLKASAQGAEQLHSGLTAAEAGSASLVAGLQSSVEGSNKVAEGAQGVAQGLEQLVQANPELAKNSVVQQLVTASKAVAQGSTQLAQGQAQLLSGGQELHAAGQQLLQGSEQLVQGQQQLVQGASQLTAGQTQLVDGMSLFDSKLTEAAAGSNVLAQGASKLSAGAGQIAGGMGQLSGGVSTLANGSKQLDAGAGEIKSGMDQLAEGSEELAAKLNDAAEQTSSVKKSDALVNMYAEPITIQEEKVSEVPNYGTGFAPYFLSLGLFVGALISTLVVPLRASTVAGASGWNRFVSRTLSFTGMSLVQSLLAAALALYGLGLEVTNIPLFYLFSFITSLSYMFIIQALVTWLDNPGRFLAILMLIFQLTTSAGTFPLELIPNWMKVFNPLLPMTYSVKGYKAVISIGDMGSVWQQAGILCMYAFCFLGITLVYFLTHSKNEDRRESTNVDMALQA